MRKILVSLAIFLLGFAISYCSFSQLGASAADTHMAILRPESANPIVPGAETEEEAALRQFKAAAQIAQQWLQRGELQHSLVGLEIMDIPSGRVLFSSNGRRRFVSASIAKVLTTACAFDTFGPDYTFKTTLASCGQIRGNRLLGPLLVVPSQDPSFTSEDLKELLLSMQDKTKAIAGEVIVLPVEGGGDHFSTEWLVQDFGQDWMPVSSDFVVDRNVAPSRDPGRGYPLSIVGADSESSALTKSLLQSAWASAWVTFDKKAQRVVFHRPDQPVVDSLPVANPTEFNAALIRTYLKMQGVKVDGHEFPMSEINVTLAQHNSKPLSEIIRFTLKESDNLYAQQLLRQLGATSTPSKALGHACLEERGLAKMSAWLSGIGVPAGDAVLFDGCGLSRKDALTPHALNTVLRHMSGPTGNGPYVDLLTHDKEGPGKTFHFKTGAMDSVRSISGIVKTATGQPLAVTAIVNAHTPQVRELRGSLHALVAQLESLGSLKLKPATSLQPNIKRPAAHQVHSKRKSRAGRIRRQ